MKLLFKKFLLLFKPLVWRLATLYDIRIDKPFFPTGQHPIIFEGGQESFTGLINKSVIFNTRSGSIRIGKNTIIGNDVRLLTGMHVVSPRLEKEKKDFHYVPKKGRDIVIGRYCYIGAAAIIIGPVKIGDNAVIGAGSIVTKDVPANCFYAGNPARLIKKRTE